jgi:ABC-type Fe3+-hydroxamate transport system substrate-binding protein
VSEVVKLEDESYQVLIINDRRAEILRPFEEVKEQARQQALAIRRAEAAQKWLEEIRKAAKVENRLEEVLAALTPKEEPKPNESQPSNDQSNPAAPANR